MLPDRSFSELYSEDAPPEAVTGVRSRTAERRGAPRVPVETDVIVAAGAQFFSGISVDLSSRGIFVATHRFLEVGALVSLEFALSDGQALARGVVRWVRQGADGVVPGLGIEFEDLSAVDRELIAKFCERPRSYTGGDANAASSDN